MVIVRVREHGEVRVRDIYAEARGVFEEQAARAAVEEQLFPARLDPEAQAVLGAHALPGAVVHKAGYFHALAPSADNAVDEGRELGLLRAYGIGPRPSCSAACMALASSFAWMEARLSPAATASPTFLCSTRPTERSISLSLVARPAAEVHAHEADARGVDVVYITSDRCRCLEHDGGVGQQRGVVYLARVAALGAG